MKRVVSVFGLGLAGSVDFAVDSALQRSSNGVDIIFSDAVPEFSNENQTPTLPVHTGLHGATRVTTPDGQSALRDISIGDQVMDAAGKMAKVQFVTKQSVDTNAVTLRAPYFGLDQDLTLGASHGVKITSEVAEYLFGEEDVIVPAWALKDDIKVRHTTLRPSEDLYSLQLSTSAELSIGACQVESNSFRGVTSAKVLNDAEARSFALECKEMRV